MNLPFYNGNSSSDEDEEVVAQADKSSAVSRSKSTSSTKSSVSDTLLRRTIIHCDVDAFYCQCESLADKEGEVSKRLGLESRPFAVGQAHIIVTCNYLARSFGIKKLMPKEAALKILPSLVIVDGSDLTLYRRQSRRIYLCFREVLSNLKLKDDAGKDKASTVKACKGGMDEMFADVSCYIFSLSQQNNNKCISTEGKMDYFVYGSQGSDISVSEDQSGATSRVHLLCGARKLSDGVPGCRYSDVNDWGGEVERKDCGRRLHKAIIIGRHVKQEIKAKTGFDVCIGISVSPMLAKIASDLQVLKPSLPLLVWSLAFCHYHYLYMIAALFP